MKFLPLLMVLCLSITCFSQDYKFGKVSQDELKETYNPKDSSANATYLYKYRKSYFKYFQNQGFRLVTDVHQRIKIYNQEGFNYATKQIVSYHEGSNSEKISNLKALTYNLENGKIVEEKLKSDGVFKNDINDYYYETTFTMPNIKPGSVIEYKYKITSPFYYKVDPFEFQHDIPIKKLEASFEVPEYFTFKLNTKGFFPVMPSSRTDTDKIRFNYKERNTTPENHVSTTFSSSELDFLKHITSYNLDNVPALKDEPYVNNIENYRSAAEYELSSTQYPNALVKYYATTWEDVVKTIYANESFGNELEKTGYYESEVDALINGVSNPIERAARIYNFIKTNIKWNGYYGKFTIDGVRKAFKDHTGNSAEINLMLTSMLRYAGLDANPVLVSTRQNGVPLFPTRDGYNYVISSIKFEDGVLLLDATDEFSSPGVLPFRTLNWVGRIIKKDGRSTTINLYPSENSSNTISMMVNLQDDGSIEGSCRAIKTKHKALSYRNDYNNTDENDYLEKFENKYGGLEVSDFKVANAFDLSKPITESYKFFKDSQADIIGDNMYFSPLFFLKTSKNPFKLEQRAFPVDFGYPSTNTYRIIVNLPEGYQVESLPEGISMALPDNLGEFKYHVSSNGKTIQLAVKESINNSIITPFYYDGLKTYFSQMITKENEQIVLKKI